jgi:hypothetical protein
MRGVSAPVGKDEILTAPGNSPRCLTHGRRHTMSSVTPLQKRIGAGSAGGELPRV